jgi:Colicin-E5 Imm protein
MSKMDLATRYDSADDFFSLGGNILMKLSREAAIAVCSKAASQNLLITRIEGGIWHSPGFEARVDCIWDGLDPPVTPKQAEHNNNNAIIFIRHESTIHDTFVITTQRVYDI